MDTEYRDETLQVTKMMKRRHILWLKGTGSLVLVNGRGLCQTPSPGGVYGTA